MNTFYVTTPIYYANGKPHLGHLYTTLVTDSLTRFKRQRGIESFMLTGTDEHGVNIERAAEARGLAVKEHVDEMVAEFQKMFALYGVEYDRWVRTTDDYHEAAVQRLWERLDENGWIYKSDYTGWFCGYCNEFKDVDAKEERPECPVHLKPLDRVSEESYFFKLSAFQKPLLELYEKNPAFIRPEPRRNEVIAFVSGGLKDLSISRASVKWGIPVPNDPAHTIYVWLDALSNYITALGWGNDRHHDYEKFWPGLHMIGKDILRFHTVYWPAFLMGAGLPVPRGVFVHGMLLRGGQKMGKTLGNAIDIYLLRNHFSNDQVRYFLLREVVFGQDGEATYEGIIDRANADLADGLGNLASRTLTMVRNYFAGTPPRALSGDVEGGREVREAIAQAKARFDEEFHALNFSRGLEAVWAALGRVDKFITDTAPWKLAKDPAARGKLEEVISVAYEGLRHLVLLAAPALPDAAREIWRQMGLAGEPLKINPNDVAWGEALDGARIGEVRPAFPKLNKEKVMAEIDQEIAARQAAKNDEAKNAAAPASGAEPHATPADAPPAAGKITIDDFIKVELRAATVLEAERVPKADKLLRLLVDVGEAAPRQILAGIAEHYAPEEVVGRRIVIVANLQPRKLRGLESNGMLLAASVGENDKPVLATFTEDVPNGARLK